MKPVDSLNILAFVLAGGRGERLYPLTLERTKPSVPFGGKYRIIDFCLSNLVNSGIYSIYVLVQYKSQSLIEHLRTTWRRTGVSPKHFITVVPPQMRLERIKDWYRGTADSVYQNINLIYDFKPDLVAIFSADHIYRMNIKDMVDYHLEKKSRFTVAVIPVAVEDAYNFGIIGVDERFRIKRFIEKPALEGKGSVFASMGNYIFDTKLLVEILEDDAQRDTSHDFGRDIIPQLVKKRIKSYAYDFSVNRVPSLKKYEAPFYWRDVGTILSYWQANRDILGSRPRFDLNNYKWPVYASSYYLPPAYVVGSKIENSFICEGCKVEKSEIVNSILGRGVVVERGCKIRDSIIMDFSHIGGGTKINKAIIDRFNLIKQKESIGFDFENDRKRYYVDKSGIVIVKRGARDAWYF